tara:strand:+ start:1637 stop:2008 length:372 start_codon:yes stop_codon:yes gene_type:complete
MAFESHFFREGRLIAAPRFDLFKVDFVLEWGNRLVKVQVKTMSKNCRNNGYSISLCTTRDGDKRQPYTSDEVDYFGVVNLDNGNIWLIPLNATEGRRRLTYVDPKLRRFKKINSFDWDKYRIK